MICFPNAKLNLGLNVNEKRGDGFHNIESFLYPISVYDVLEFKESHRTNIEYFGLTETHGLHNDILHKTWEILNTRYGIPPLKMNLLKNIPIGSGLGGGSSDAAYLIRFVNFKFMLNLGLNDMRLIAAIIGSDCPFFIENKPAIVSGRGEKQKNLQAILKGKYYIVIAPNEGIITSDAFAQIKPRKSKKSIYEIISQPIKTWKNELKNDFEDYVNDSIPETANLKDMLYQNDALYASLTGSGSAVYGIFNKKPKIDGLNKYHSVWSGIFN